MTVRVLAAVLAALATGTAIAVQSTLTGRAGAVIGPLRTGLMVNTAGGTIAVVIVLVAALVRFAGRVDAGLLILSGRTAQTPQVVTWIVVAGLLGIAIIVGVSYSVQGAGVTAGLSAIILSQLVLGMVIDHFGGAGGTAVTIDLRRIAGVAAMALGVWLLVPRS